MIARHYVRRAQVAAHLRYMTLGIVVNWCTNGVNNKQLANDINS